jgi:TolB-like protein/DNA-binding winged helix-turn-helix (wHTH) protein/Tfp pilus assembly protein PilF
MSGAYNRGMRANASKKAVIRFDIFELELKSGELRRDGALIKLQPQPFRALAFLADRSGQVVTRGEIQREIWGDETFVDYEQGVNFCIKQIRAALGDDAKAPRFIETLPRRGYRFIAPVERDEGNLSWENDLAVAPAPDIIISPPESVPDPSTISAAVSATQTRTRVFLVAALAVAMTLALAGYVVWQGREKKAVPPTGKIILVVLPFENLSGDPEQDYFSDGLTEEMITRIGRLQPQRLGVIARTSAMVFKKGGKDITRIGGALGAAYVLEGGVRREADRLRITAQLIQVSDQTHLWAGAYDRRIHDALTIQSEVAESIAQSLAIKLLSGPQPAPAQAHIPNPDSYDAYLRGCYLRNKWTRDDMEKAVGRFEQAVEKDPDYALAHAALAEAWCYLQFFGGARPQDARAKAKNAALKAVVLDETLAEARAALASVRFWYDWDWQGAEQEFTRALALNPSLASAHHDYGWLLIARERFDEGLAEVKRAQELDPLSPQANVDVGWACIRARRYDEAIAQSRRTMELEPNFAEAWGCLMRAYQYAGRFAEAIAEAQRIMTRSGASQEELAALHRGDAASGMRIVEQWMLNRTKKAAGLGYVSDYHLAAQYAALGEKEQAFKWLEKAYTDRDPMTALLNTDPAYDRLRSEPRFGDFLRRIRVATQAVRPQ